jgi:hypothetical protein
VSGSRYLEITCYIHLQGHVVQNKFQSNPFYGTEEKLSVSQPVKKSYRILWKLKYHCRAHNSLQLVPVLSQTNPGHTTRPVPLRHILPLSSHPRLDIPVISFHQVSPTKTLYAPLLSPILATCPVHLILFVLFTRIMRSTGNKAHPYVVISNPVLCRPSESQISSSAPYPRTSSAYVPPTGRKTKFHTHTKQQANL